MGWHDVGAERTSWRLANSSNVINTAGRTRWNYSFAVEFDVGRQVAGEIDAVAVGQVMLQGELIRSGINLAEVVNAGVCRTGSRPADIIWNDGCKKEPNDEDYGYRVDKL